MGSGIAQVAAGAGMAVLLADMTQALAEAARAKIAGGLNRLVQKDKLTADKAAATLARITPVDRKSVV